MLQNGTNLCYLWSQPYSFSYCFFPYPVCQGMVLSDKTWHLLSIRHVIRELFTVFKFLSFCDLLLQNYKRSLVSLLIPKSFLIRPSSDAVLHMSRIECKWEKSFVLPHMGSRYHQKYKQYKQSRINRNGLNVLCYLVQFIWKWDSYNAVGPVVSGGMG